MQQATLAETDSSVATGRDPLSAPNAFVINLVSSTTPVALARPDHAGLKRFTFFVSRRREDGRERFRLHMGFFETQEEAEKLLDLVREIYPGAWAGLAPGRALRAAAAAGLPGRTPSPGPSEARPEAPGSAPTAATAPKVPRTQIPARRADTIPALALVPDEGRRLPAELSEENEVHAAVRSLGNIRAAIASLDDPAANAPTLRPLPELTEAVTRPLPTVSSAAAPKVLSAVHQRPSASADELSDSAALRLLESRAKGPDPLAANRAAGAPLRAPAGAPAHGTALEAGRVPSVPRPAGEAPKAPRPQPPAEDRPCYAVQLVWSVQPIDMLRVPQLAIFSAYTLYRAEGNRDGRRWYGVRLGFFTDAVSAKQVAHYVRADFSTVSVVPVTAREREYAKLAVSRPGGAIKPVSAAAAPAPSGQGFEFIDDSESMKLKQAKKARAPAARSLLSRPAREAPGKRAKPRTAGQIHARRKVKPMTLEQTLEILGASQLNVENDAADASINDSGVRHLRLEPNKAKPSKLSRLFERLSERIGN